jgi:hypothetical protein
VINNFSGTTEDRFINAAGKEIFFAPVTSGHLEGKRCGFLGAFAKTAKSDYWFHHVCLSAWNSSAPTGRIFMKFDD